MYQYIINLENSARIEIDGLHRKIERMQCGYSILAVDIHIQYTNRNVNRRRKYGQNY
jgi:hypothetical protein